MRHFYRFLIICIFLLCGACQPNIYQSKAYVFGTLVEVQIAGVSTAQAEQASHTVFNAYQQWHQRLHAWQTSELQALNQAIALKQKYIPITQDIAPLLKQAQSLSAQSQGLFNPAIGHLIALWGFQRDEIVASEVDLSARDRWLSAKPSMQDLEVYSDHIISLNPAVQLDLGGYAKGYALDLGLKLLRQQGIQNALINIGGNVIALGKNGKKLWRVGIQHPRKPNAIAALDLPSGWAIGTSGDYQRYYVKNGKRYCHIIDPNTGSPARHMQAVTVLVPAQQYAGVLSDVASKPIFVSSPGTQTTMAKRMGIENYLWINAQGEVRVSASMAKKLIWLDQQAKNKLVQAYAKVE